MEREQESSNTITVVLNQEILRKFRKVKFIVTMLGGTIPYFCNTIDLLFGILPGYFPWLPGAAFPVQPVVVSGVPALNALARAPGPRHACLLERTQAPPITTLPPSQTYLHIHHQTELYWVHLPFQI